MIGSWFSFYPSRIPDPGVKKAPDPGSATLEKGDVRPVEEAGDENGEEQHGDDDESGHEEGEDVLLVGDQQRELRLLRRF